MFCYCHFVQEAFLGHWGPLLDFVFIPKARGSLSLSSTVVLTAVSTQMLAWLLLPS